MASHVSASTAAGFFYRDGARAEVAAATAPVKDLGFKILIGWQF